jgi:DNA-binding NtrC family response regulator
MSSGQEVLVVEDEVNVRELVRDVLSAKGIAVSTCQSLAEAAESIGTRRPDAMVLDVKLADGDGLRFLEQLRTNGTHIPTVVLTAFGTVDRAVQAMRAGARDFVVKPFDNDRLVNAVRAAIATTEQLADVGMAAGVVDARAAATQKLIGASAGLKDLVTLLPRVASSECNVLIRGESGTGKEMIARAIHASSPRSDGAFVAVNCAALPQTLLEAELFGFERGAFTGAHARKKGIIETADGGTLFLDEIGDMPLEAQSRLLRVVQERELMRVGATTPVKLDVRILAATHRDLQSMSSSGAFREDLLFRLAVLPIDVPPLRARKKDLRGLVDHFITKHAPLKRAGTDLRPTDAFFAAADGYGWPGNVRELENCVQRALVLGTFDAAQLLGGGSTKSSNADVPQSPGSPRTVRQEVTDEVPAPHRPLRTMREAVTEAERDAVLAALRHAHGNKAEAARLLGISYKTLFNKLHEHGIREDLRFE